MGAIRSRVPAASALAVAARLRGSEFADRVEGAVQAGGCEEARPAEQGDRACHRRGVLSYTMRHPGVRWREKATAEQHRKGHCRAKSTGGPLGQLSLFHFGCAVER
eukprot:6207817-Pleurochrysis_carterae.AAC.1